MSLKLKATSNGSVTLSPQDTASDVVVTVPNVTAELLNNSSGVLNIGSGQVYKDASGNLGVGTSTPDSKLQVETATAKLRIGYNGTSENYYDANTHYFRSGAGAERARIDSSGNLLVGATATSAYFDGKLNVEGRFHVKVTTENDRQYIWNTANSGTRQLLSFVVGSSPSVVGSVTSNGTSTTYATTSDYRLKENIQPMQNALATVAALNPVTYTWKADGSAGQGFIAHELQGVVPDCVTGEKDAVDAEGNPQYQGVDTSFLVATLVAAIQELKAEVDDLKAQLQGAA